MTDTKYNGWTNYETWLANLWYDDAFTEIAEEIYNDSTACETFTKAENAAISLSEHIESTIDEVETENMPESGFMADLVNAGLRSVNYHEIAEHYIQDISDE